ncbi:MAG: amino acid permease [Gammaproteobacteria bacterium]|nr:amino acid permease [Gammaproteobacteria bacterium]
MQTTKRPHLLGFWMCVALVVGNSIGSGVFLLPASLAPYGLNSVLAWGLTACGAVLLAIVFAQLSRAYPQAGGPYAYVHLAFGSFTAFIVAWGYWISIWVGNAAIATGAVSYLTPLMPWIGTVPGASAAVTLCFLWVLTWVNCHGIKAAGWVQSVTTVLKILPLLAVSALGLFSVGSPMAAGAAAVPLSLSGTTAAATLTLWAFLGLESATIPAGKVRDPGRTIPRATLVGTILTAFICIVACTTVLLLVPPDVLAKSNAPFVDLVTAHWGVRAGKLLAVFAAISAFGALNGWILLQGELPNVMAKNGMFPQLFARDSARHTPTFALLFSSGLVTILILMNYQKSMVSVFTFMILLSTTACLVLYLLCSLALLRLRWMGHIAGHTKTRRRGPLSLALVGVIATLYSLWALIGAGRDAVVWGGVLLALGAPLYFLVRDKAKVAV